MHKNWIKYLKYHLRWQSGILFTWPVMYVLKDVLHCSDVITIVAFQFVGAVIYWFIDKSIFKNKEVEAIETKLPIIKPVWDTKAKHFNWQVVGFKSKSQPKPKPQFKRTQHK